MSASRVPVRPMAPGAGGPPCPGSMTTTLRGLETSWFRVKETPDSHFSNKALSGNEGSGSAPGALRSTNSPLSPTGVTDASRSRSNSTVTQTPPERSSNKTRSRPPCPTGMTHRSPSLA